MAVACPKHKDKQYRKGNYYIKGEGKKCMWSTMCYREGRPKGKQKCAKTFYCPSSKTGKKTRSADFVKVSKKPQCKRVK